MHMKSFKFYLLLVTSIVSGYPFQSDSKQFFPVKDVEALKVRLQNNAQNTRTIVSDFVQEKHLTMLDEVIISKGHFMFKKENSIRWEYNEPIKYLIIIHNGKFIIKDEDKVTKFDTESNMVFREINKIIVNMVSGRLPDEKDFEINFFENANFYQTELIPKSQEVEKILQTIQIFIEKKDLTVSEVKLIESAEDYTSITIVNKQLNIEIPENKFLTK